MWPHPLLTQVISRKPCAYVLVPVWAVSPLITRPVTSYPARACAMSDSGGELSEGIMAAFEGQSQGGSLGYSAEGASSGHGRSDASSDELRRSPAVRGRPLGPVHEGSREGSRGSGTGQPLKVDGYQPTRGVRSSGARSREASAHSPMGRPPLPNVPGLPGSRRQSPAPEPREFQRGDPVLEELMNEMETTIVEAASAAPSGSASGPHGTAGGNVGGRC